MSLLKICSELYELDIIGLMCIPPDNGKFAQYFQKMKILKEKFKLKDHMGMSGDYKSAIENGATFVRIGSKIFGKRIT